MRRFFVFLFLILLSFPKSTFANGRLWQITSVDTMKYSRDRAREKETTDLIPIQVKAAAELGVNYIALDTPYDDNFIPRLTEWVEEARKYNLKVWFRGNFSGWEGWFDYPKLSSTNEHITKTYRFITNNPTLFEDGDIFTPAPEAEAGIMGDPRQTRKFAEFNKFLVDSYDNCNKAFTNINKKVNCGIWSLNTDVIREVLTKDTVKKLGGIISIDHYTKSPEKLISDVEALKKQFDAKVVLGEFGAPIPDINGVMTDEQQGKYMASLMSQLYQHPDLIHGMNYWVLNGGSTTLINNDNTPRSAYFEIQKYFAPITLSGTINDKFGEPLPNVQIESIDKVIKVKTDSSGKFQISFPAKPNELNIFRDDLISTNYLIQNMDSKNQTLFLILEPVNPDLWYKLKLWFHQHFTHPKPN